MGCAWWVDAGAAAPGLVDGVGFAASGVGGCCTVPLAAGAARMWCLCAVVCLALRGLVHRCVDDRFPSRVSALLVGSGPVDLFGLGIGRCGGRPGETLGLRRRPRRWRRLWRRFPPLRLRRGPLLPPTLASALGENPVPLGGRQRRCSSLPFLEASSGGRRCEVGTRLLGLG